MVQKKLNGIEYRRVFAQIEVIKFKNVNRCQPFGLTISLLCGNHNVKYGQ